MKKSLKSKRSILITLLIIPMVIFLIFINIGQDSKKQALEIEEVYAVITDKYTNDTNDGSVSEMVYNPVLDLTYPTNNQTDYFLIVKMPNSNKERTFKTNFEMYSEYHKGDKVKVVLDETGY